MTKCLQSLPLFFSWLGSTYVDAMEIIGTEGSVTLGTFALAGIIAGLNTLKAENMKTLGKYSILFTHVATWTGQACLVVLNLLHQNLITFGYIVWFLRGLQLPSKSRDVLLGPFEIEHIFFFGDTVLYNLILKIM